jgi:hypothetical protein
MTYFKIRTQFSEHKTTLRALNKNKKKQIKDIRFTWNPSGK